MQAAIARRAVHRDAAGPACQNAAARTAQQRTIDAMPMHKPPLPGAGTPDDTEQQFYDALQRGDIEQMMALWSDDDEIVCVRPNGPRLVGPAAIRAAFAAWFAVGPVATRPAKVRRVQWPGGAAHNVLERIAGNGSGKPTDTVLVTTNVYTRTGLGWRIVAHHASAGGNDAEAHDPGPTVPAALLH